MKKSPTFILDTSVLVKCFSQEREENVQVTDQIISLALDQKIKLIAPELVKYELGNVLLCAKKFKPTEAAQVFQLLSLLPIHFIKEDVQLATLSFALAHQDKITYYDATFLALAKRQQATLITENTKHQGKNSSIRVIALKDFTSSQY